MILVMLRSVTLIEKRLGKLPPTLAELYDKMHRDSMDRLGEEERKISENAIRWLLCGQSSFRANSFLYVMTFDVDVHLQPTQEMYSNDAPI